MKGLEMNNGLDEDFRMFAISLTIFGIITVVMTCVQNIYIANCAIESGYEQIDGEWKLPDNKIHIEKK